jgi:microcin C transport system permease protein
VRASLSDGGIAAKPLAPTGRKPRRFRLSPINRRRLENFKANKRGYWSFWIFLFFFVLSLFSEFIANDRPLVVAYKGEILFPILRDYPEEKFGGFLAQTDYRDAVIAKEIAEHGFMIWPPVRYSYKTINRQLPVPAPSPPTWMLSEAQCRAAAKRFDKGQPNGDCKDIEWNWLGTDDQGRDVLARLLYGFRLSLLFGLTLAGVSSVVGIAAGAVQGYFGGWTDLIFQRFIEIWSSLPHLYLLIIISSIITPSFFVLLGILLLFSWVSLVHVVRAEFCAPVISNMSMPRARSGSPMERSSSNTCCQTRWSRP